MRFFGQFAIHLYSDDKRVIFARSYLTLSFLLNCLFALRLQADTWTVLPI